MKEVHICPLLMRTVVFEDEKCTENCDVQECPVECQGTPKLRIICPTQTDYDNPHWSEMIVYNNDST